MGMKEEEEDECDQGKSDEEEVDWKMMVRKDGDDDELRERRSLHTGSISLS